MRFALKMGFRPDDICEGFAVCDYRTLSPGRHPANARERRKFLFVGRYAPAKGVSILVEAYRLYSCHSAEPWPLIVAGDGPLIQTKELSGVLAQAGCLVLPSILEPWGVVIHEAVAAGLGVICTDECGAGDVFLQHAVNGFVIPTGNVLALADVMKTFADSEDFLECLPNASIEMSKRLLPSSFAESVIPFIQSKRQLVS
jgi:glycosyltransferase involved in cell wall biosynthesis